eukprot:CAMPEP_0119505428 /NCGR_PEP_ID=MMETSP1344-20130328/25972_1 /TAXON_ID=236787 /ORGANISM="Florenciella parvula, Strain CCMP2471" /LENGTH=62 /DNA_ID=CAMNT_0007541883 /DNA_START=101 /DNA_END=289 /DNA_ORIENTATION=-
MAGKWHARACHGGSAAGTSVAVEKVGVPAGSAGSRLKGVDGGLRVLGGRVAVLVEDIHCACA